MAEGTVRKTRLRSIDVFKGFAIIVIVIAHLFLFQPSSGGAVTETSSLKVTLIEFFYVGLIVFFAISGYFYNPEEGFSKKVIGRLVKLIVVIFLAILVLTILMYIYLTVLGYGISLDAFWRTLVNDLAGGGTAFTPYNNESMKDISACGIVAGYWFLFVLFFSTIIYHIIAKWSLRNTVNTVVTIVILLTVTMLCVEVVGFRLPYYLELVPVATSAMLIESILKKYSLIEMLERDTFKKEIVVSFVIALVVGVLLCYSDLRSDLGFHRAHFGLFGGWSAYTILFVALVCGYSHLYLCALVAKIPYLSDFFVFFGKYTLGILVLSTFYSKIVIAPFMTLPACDCTYPEMGVGTMLAVAVAALILSVITTYLAKKVYAMMKEKYNLPF